MKRVLPVVTALLLCCTLQVNAAESFSVSPTTLEMSVGNATQQITVHNISSKVQTYRYEFEPFTLDAQGSFQFTQSDSEYRRIFSQTTLTPSTITIEPGKSTTLQVTINPQKLSQKDYYYAILIGPNPDEVPTDATVSQIAPKAAIPLLFSAARHPRRDIFIDSFQVPRLVFSQSPTLSLTLANHGNMFEQTQGSIVVKNLAGKTVETITLPSQYVLAGTERTLHTAGKDIQLTNHLLGMYRVTAVVQTSSTSFSQTHVLVAVPPMLLLLLAVIAFISSGIYLRVKKYRTA